MQQTTESIGWPVGRGRVKASPVSTPAELANIASMHSPGAAGLCGRGDSHPSKRSRAALRIVLSVHSVPRLSKLEARLAANSKKLNLERGDGLKSNGFVRQDSAGLLPTDFNVRKCSYEINDLNCDWSTDFNPQNMACPCEIVACQKEPDPLPRNIVDSRQNCDKTPAGQEGK